MYINLVEIQVTVPNQLPKYTLENGNYKTNKTNKYYKKI